MRHGAMVALALALTPMWLPEGSSGRPGRLDRPVVLPIRPQAEAKGRRGYAAHYRPNLMEQVSRNRGLPIVDCMVAAEGRIGRWLEVRSLLNGNVESCRITDVCAPRDCGRLRKAGILVEFGWTAAKRFCNLSYYGEKPPRACPVEVFG